MTDDRIQVEAAFRYLNEPRSLKIDKKSCRFYDNRIRGTK